MRTAKGIVRAGTSRRPNSSTPRNVESRKCYPPSCLAGPTSMSLTWSRNNGTHNLRGVIRSRTYEGLSAGLKRGLKGCSFHSGGCGLALNFARQFSNAFCGSPCASIFSLVQVATLPGLTMRPPKSLALMPPSSMFERSNEGAKNRRLRTFDKNP